LTTSGSDAGAGDGPRAATVDRWLRPVRSGPALTLCRGAASFSREGRPTRFAMTDARAEVGEGSRWDGCHRRSGPELMPCQDEFRGAGTDRWAGLQDLPRRNVGDGCGGAVKVAQLRPALCRMLATPRAGQIPSGREGCGTLPGPTGTRSANSAEPGCVGWGAISETVRWLPRTEHDTARSGWAPQRCRYGGALGREGRTA